MAEDSYMAKMGSQGTQSSLRAKKNNPRLERDNNFKLYFAGQLVDQNIPQLIYSDSINGNGMKELSLMFWVRFQRRLTETERPVEFMSLNNGMGNRYALIAR